MFFNGAGNFRYLISITVKTRIGISLEQNNNMLILLRIVSYRVSEDILIFFNIKCRLIEMILNTVGP